MIFLAPVFLAPVFLASIFLASIFLGRSSSPRCLLVRTAQQIAMLPLSHARLFRGTFVTLNGAYEGGILGLIRLCY